MTGITQVNILGGIIHRNVYGGGSLASVGPPAIPPSRKETAYKKDATTRDAQYGDETIGRGWWSECFVNIGGGTGTVNIGTPTDYKDHYGGEVYGGSRGMSTVDASSFANTVWTQVNIKNGTTIMGNVFGGGDAGTVKRNTDVQIGAE